MLVWKGRWWKTNAVLPNPLWTNGPSSPTSAQQAALLTESVLHAGGWGWATNWPGRGKYNIFASSHQVRMAPPPVGPPRPMPAVCSPLPQGSSLDLPVPAWAGEAAGADLGLSKMAQPADLSKVTAFGIKN